MKTIVKFLILQIFLLVGINSSLLAYNYSWSTHEDITNLDKPPCKSLCGCNADGSAKTCEKPPNRCGSLFSKSGGVGGKTGSPVYLKTGYFTWSDSDIVLAGKPSLSLSRTYTAFDSHLGLFGNSWVSNVEKLFLKTIQYSKDENGTKQSETYFVYRQADGLRYFYKYNENNDSFVDLGNIRLKAKRVDAHIATLTYPNDTVETYQDGYLIKRVDNLGNAVTLTYDENYLLQKVSNGSGTLTFNYNSNGFVSQITDQTGRIWQYSYDTDEKGIIIVKIIYPYNSVSIK